MKTEVALPEVNASQLMHKIRRDISWRRSKGDKFDNSSPAEISTMSGQLSSIKRLIDTAASRANARENIPAKYLRFPFFVLRPFQKIVLRLFNIILKDQREVNHNVLSSLRQSLYLDQYLLSEFENMRSQMRENQALSTEVIELSLRLEQAITQLNNCRNQLAHQEAELLSLKLEIKKKS